MTDTVPKIVAVALDDVWDDLRPRLDDMHARFAPGWRPEDVYMEVRQGHFTILRAADEPIYAVVRKRPMRHSPERDELFLWIVVGDGDDIIKRFQPALDQLARDGGADRMVFETPRAGFQRLDGWKLRMTIYHRYLR